MSNSNTDLDLGPGPDRIERWENLLALLKHNQKLTVDGVSTQLQVSRSTVRRDFDELARQGLARRVHGGVVAHDGRQFSHLPETSSRSKQDQAIAEAAAAMVSEGMTVGMSGTSPVLATARLIASRSDLAEYSRDSITVVTSNMQLGAEMAMWPHIRTIALGGVVHPMSGEMVGPIPVASAEGLWQDILFLGVAGVDAQAGATSTHDYESAVLGLMASHSTDVTVLVRGSRVGKHGFSVICPITSVTRMITTADADADALQMIQDKGVDVVIA